MNDKLQSALALAAKGFRVFPLIPNGKVPAIQGWPAKATVDTATIERWFGPDPVTGWVQDHNIGVATGQGLVVLDVDCKNGAKGFDSLAALEAIHDIPDTFTVTTPTGGKHAYFATDVDIRNSAGKIADGLDIRGTGGFVVGPGSTIGGQAYVAVSGDPPVARAPAVLSAGRRVGEHPAPDAAKARIDLDTPGAIARATAYLHDAEPAVEGAGGNHHTFAVAARLKDIGVSQDTALTLMLDHWNERCAPAWNPEDLQITINNAYTYSHNPPGIASPAMDFEPITTESTGRKLYFKHYDDVVVDTDTRPLVEDWLDQGAFSVLYGESNTGKTFVALDLGFHIAANKPWLNKQTEPGGVVYVAAEGGRGITKRIDALKKTHPGVPVSLVIVPCSINLRGRSADTEALIKLVDEAALALGTPVVFIVIDTLSRAMAGANENASEDMTAFVAAIDRIRQGTNAHVMVVHHSGKDTAKGSRGHSSLRAATDTEFEVADNTLTVRKQRDMDYAEAKAFRLQSVDVATSRSGKVITSCVVAWAAPGAEFEPVELTPTEQGHLDALEDAQASAGKPHATTAQVVAVLSAGGKDMNERTVRRWMQTLCDKQAARRLARSTWSTAAS